MTDQKNNNVNLGDGLSGKQKNLDKTTSTRGFASMDQDRQKEIASKGGKAAHLSGHAHQFTSEEAREAGRKGGQASQSGTTMGTNFNQQRTIDKDISVKRSLIDDDEEDLDSKDNFSKSRSSDNSKY